MSIARAALVCSAAVALMVGCGADDGPGCGEFLKKNASGDFSNPTGYDVIVEAYQEKYPDEESAPVAKLYSLAPAVQRGCQQDPDSLVVDHLPD